MIRDKRILLVSGLLELGGAERQALLLARHLTEKGIRAEIWGFHCPGKLAELCSEHGIPWRIVPVAWPHSGMLRWPRRALSLSRFALALNQLRPDIIMSYNVYPSVVCGLTRRLTGAPVWIWNQRDEGLGRMGIHSERLATRQASWFIANSQASANFLVQGLDIRPSNVTVIHNGVQLPIPLSDRTTWRARLGLAEDDFVACMIANLSHQKDHVVLLRAWRSVVDRMETSVQSTVLLLAGRFVDTYPMLLSLAQDLGLEDRVRFLGWVDDIAGLLYASDLAVFSSRSEGSPNGVLEAMAAGLAVAATDIPGIREAVGPEGYDFLAPPGDFHALADAISGLILDETTREKLGAENQTRVRAKFSPKKMCEDTISVMSQALDCSRQ